MISDLPARRFRSAGFASVAGRRASLSIAALALALSGCGGILTRSQLDNFSLTYRINIQQGIVVTQEMADQLKPGMTRDQVKFIMGTPILADPFHAARWDYPFRFQPGRGRVEERRFTVYFENDKLARFEGDPFPTEEEFAASRNFATTKVAKAPPLAPAKPQTPGSSAPSGGANVTGTPVNVPIHPTPPASESPPPPPPSSNSDETPR